MMADVRGGIEKKAELIILSHVSLCLSEYFNRYSSDIEYAPAITATVSYVHWNSVTPVWLQNISLILKTVGDVALSLSDRHDKDRVGKKSHCLPPYAHIGRPLR